MADDSDIVNNTGKMIVLTVILIFAIGVALWMLQYGRPDNSLHVSGLSWAMTLILVVLCALGFVGAVDKISVLLPKK